MSVAFQKWGNGLALRGPQMFADESGASDGKPGEMTMSDGKLVIAQAALCRLVKGMTPENYYPEFDWGRPSASKSGNYCLEAGGLV
jgi:antitoxin component of MazEF toxin-antitoxin module